MNENIEIACRAATRSRFPFAGDANACAVVDARRDLHFDSLGRIDPTFAMAIVAGIGDYLPQAMAAWTGAFDEEQALLRTDFAMALACRAGLGRGARLGTRTVAGLA